jgi:hypothetical protein
MEFVFWGTCADETFMHFHEILIIIIIIIFLVNNCNGVAH